MASPWIRRLLNKPENAFMCAVDESYIRDRFNLVGLEETLPGYETAVRVVLDEVRESRVAADSDVRSAAVLLYGLMHARFVMSPRGVAKILEKYVAGCFGHCPRVYCRHSVVLPIGLYDVIGKDTVKIYCPRCMDVYAPVAGAIAGTIDGAYFGTGLPHMVFMTRPEYIPPRPKDRYVAKLYGFQVHDSATNLQRKEATKYRRSMQQPSAFTTASTTTISTIPSAAEFATIVSPNAADQTSSLVNITNSHGISSYLLSKR